jgi:hypothetical protein
LALSSISTMVGLTKHLAGNNLLKTPFRENGWLLGML